MGDLAVKRFLKTAALLDSDNEHERAVAARQASALLRAAGLDWAAVLQAGLTSLGHFTPLEPVKTAPRFEDFFGDLFKVRPKAPPTPVRAPAAPDIFKDVLSGFSRRPTATDPMDEAVRAAMEGSARSTRFRKRTGRTDVSGEAIPFHVMGVPRLVDRREKEWTMLVFYLDAETAHYGPLVAFDHIDTLSDAMANKTTVSGHVTQPTSPLHLPKFKMVPLTDA